MPPTPTYSIIIMLHQLCEDVGSGRKQKRHVQKLYFQNFTSQYLSVISNLLVISILSVIRYSLYTSVLFARQSDLAQSASGLVQHVRSKFCTLTSYYNSNFCCIFKLKYQNLENLY